MMIPIPSFDFIILPIKVGLDVDKIDVLLRNNKSTVIRNVSPFQIPRSPTSMVSATAGTTNTLLGPPSPGFPAQMMEGYFCQTHVSHPVEGFTVGAVITSADGKTTLGEPTWIFDPTNQETTVSFSFSDTNVQSMGFGSELNDILLHTKQGVLVVTLLVFPTTNFSTDAWSAVFLLDAETERVIGVGVCTHPAPSSLPNGGTLSRKLATTNNANSTSPTMQWVGSPLIDSGATFTDALTAQISALEAVTALQELTSKPAEIMNYLKCYNDFMCSYVSNKIDGLDVPYCNTDTNQCQSTEPPPPKHHFLWFLVGFFIVLLILCIVIAVVIHHRNKHKRATATLSVTTTTRTT